MTELDQALETLRASPDDHKAMSGFYDLLLNSILFIPTVNEPLQTGDQAIGEEVEVPLIIEADGTDYLVFFDQRQRLNAWAERGAPCVQLPGHMLAEMTPAGLHWAMNVGTPGNKQFAPDEIAWLKEVVAHCKAADDSPRD